MTSPEHNHDVTLIQLALAIIFCIIFAIPLFAMLWWFLSFFFWIAVIVVICWLYEYFTEGK